MKDLYVRLTSNMNTKQLMTDFSNNYDRMIITNRYKTKIFYHEYSYYIIITKHIPKGNIDYGLITINNSNSISLTDLKNDDLWRAYSYCDKYLKQLLWRNRTNSFKEKQEIHFKKGLLLRYQTIEEEWGHYRLLAIAGVIITSVNQFKKPKEEIKPKIDRMNLYYRVIYKDMEYHIDFDEANNYHKALEVFNKKYKGTKNGEKIIKKNKYEKY